VRAVSGVVRPFSSAVLARPGKTFHEWGIGPAGGSIGLALRYPDRVGVIDELGALTRLLFEGYSGGGRHRGDDAEFGERLRACVVVSEDCTEDELKEWVRQNLARFKVPREFVLLGELSRNATGKVLKRELVGWQLTEGGE
jgi:acyl-CoA synthetase (AMP-forming)/AMP-acid ligase II